ncbi:MAG: DUF4097 family beta strand repeat-containing protein [Candidatus Izemoplasmatales bacterium]|nr:DUF4097 family beta strand repeat-containing protein [Candidatus Izemoplasmatales bacterium]
MNKALRITLALVLIALVGVLVFGLMTKGTFGFIQNEEYILVEKTYTASEYSKFDFEVDNRSVTVLPSTTGNVELSYYDSENDFVELLENGDTLKLINDPVWYHAIFSGIFPTEMSIYNKMTLYLPQTVDYELDIQSTNGRVEVSECDNLLALTLETTNGSLFVNSVSCTGLVSVETVNGGVYLDSVVFQSNVELTSSNGGIHLEDVLVSGEIVAETTNGGLEMDTIQANQMDLTSVNGSVDGDKIVASQVNIVTTNGHIDMEIDGLFADYHVQMLTGNGSYYLNGTPVTINIYHTDQTNKLDFKTTNGSIRVSFTE